MGGRTCHGVCCGYLNVPSTRSMENVGISQGVEMKMLLGTGEGYLKLRASLRGMGEDECVLRLR